MKQILMQFLIFSLAYAPNAFAEERLEDGISPGDEINVDVDTMELDQDALFNGEFDRRPDDWRRFMVECTASPERRFGPDHRRSFSAVGWFPRIVQERALHKCEQQTWRGRCVPTGCHRFHR